MTTARTPGPYRAVDEFYGEARPTGIRIENNESDKVAEINSAQTQDFVNARFIVKACNAHDELVAALEALLAAKCSAKDLSECYSEIQRVKSIARAALAKVQG